MRDSNSCALNHRTTGLASNLSSPYVTKKFFWLCRYEGLGGGHEDHYPVESRWCRTLTGVC